MPVPAAATEKVTLFAGKHILVLTGWALIVTGLFTVRVTQVEVTLPHELVILSLKAVPFIAEVTAFTFKVALVAPGIFVKVPEQLNADCH